MTFFKQRTRLSRALMILAVVLGGGALFLGSQSANAANVTVTIADNSFTQSSVTVNVGEMVTWTYPTGISQHTVTSDGGTFQSSGNISPGGTYAVTFTAAGTYSYHCAFHPTQMTGTVTVTGAAATATATSTTAGTATATATATNTATTTQTGGTSTPTRTATATSVPPTATSTPRPPTATAVPATATAAASPAPAAPRTGTTPPPSGGSSSLQIVLLGVAGVLGIAGVGLALAKRRM